MTLRADVSVIVPAFGRPDLLQACVSSVLASSGQLRVELIVVDDGTQPPLTPGDTGVLTSPHKLIRHRTNRGRGAAINSGLDVASGDVLVLCDSDIYLEAAAIREHYTFHDLANDPLATFLGDLTPSTVPTLWTETVGARNRPHIQPGMHLPWYMWLTDNWSFCRSGFSNSVRFDERFRSWGWEDFHLGFHLSRADFSSTACNGARGTHLKSTEPFQLIQALRASRKNLQLLLEVLSPSEDAVLQLLADLRAHRATVDAAESAFRTVWTCLAPPISELLDGSRGPFEPALRNVAEALVDFVSLIGLAEGTAPNSGYPGDELLRLTARHACQSGALLLRSLGDFDGALRLAKVPDLLVQNT